MKMDEIISLYVHGSVMFTYRHHYDPSPNEYDSNLFKDVLV